MFYIRFHRILWYIRCCHQTTIKRFHDYPLLSGNPYHPTMDALEFTFSYHHFISQLILDIFRSNWDDVWILHRCQADEIIHGRIRNY